MWLPDCSARINLVMLTRDCYAKEKREEKFCLSSLPGTAQAPEPALNLRAPAKRRKPKVLVVFTRQFPSFSSLWFQGEVVTPARSAREPPGSGSRSAGLVNNGSGVIWSHTTVPEPSLESQTPPAQTWKWGPAGSYTHGSGWKTTQAIKDNSEPFTVREMGRWRFPVPHLRGKCIFMGKQSPFIHKKSGKNCSALLLVLSGVKRETSA